MIRPVSSNRVTVRVQTRDMWVRCFQSPIPPTGHNYHLPAPATELALELETHHANSSCRSRRELSTYHLG